MIEKKYYGFHLTFGGKLSAEEMTAWLEESREALQGCKRGFGVFVDMRELELNSPDVQSIFEAGQRYYKDMGMARSVVILRNPTLAIQFKRIALQSDIYDYERYVDASLNENWEEIGLKWVIEGIDPDADLREKIAVRIDQGIR